MEKMIYVYKRVVWSDVVQYVLLKPIKTLEEGKDFEVIEFEPIKIIPNYEKFAEENYENIVLLGYDPACKYPLSQLNGFGTFGVWKEK